MEKYREKQSRYELTYNEATERNQSIVNRIYQEQVKRQINKHVEIFRKARMDIS